MGRLNTVVSCSRCGGSRIADVPIAPKREDPCTSCGGRGVIPLGELSYECGVCDASGQVLAPGGGTMDCPECLGSGYKPFDYSVIEDIQDKVNDIFEQVGE